jgi:hypothetical protein
MEGDLVSASSRPFDLPDQRELALLRVLVIGHGEVDCSARDGSSA